MKCPACGAENEKDDKFCNLCLKPFQDGKQTLEQLEGRSSLPNKKEPGEEMHDPSSNSGIKLAYQRVESDPDRWLQDFTPAWKRFVAFVWIAAVILVIWMSILFTNLHKIDMLANIGIFLGIALFIPFLYISSKLNCPNCSRNVYWFTYLKKWGFAWTQFVRSGKYPNCGVQLKKRGSFFIT